MLSFLFMKGKGQLLSGTAQGDSGKATPARPGSAPRWAWAQWVQQAGLRTVPVCLLQTMNRPHELHCSIMSHELKYIINILDKLILPRRQKAYYLHKWGKFPNNNEEFLSLQTIPQINKRGSQSPDQGPESSFTVHSLMGGQAGLRTRPAAAAVLRPINNPL